MPFDLSWNNLIYGPGPHLIAWILNSTINSMRTPDMLKLWGYKKHANCSLCGAELCSLHHIIANCDYALDQGRYTWRHDSVLLYLQKILSLLLAHNATSASVPHCAPHIPFVKQGESRKRRPKVSGNSASVLQGTNDWKLLVDFTANKIVFPPEIYVTTERPDICIFSRSRKIIYLIELTCPAEEGIEPAQIRKEARYAQLVDNINADDKNPWKAVLLTIEAGARGYVAHSMRSFLRKFGFTPGQAKQACKTISSITARCTFEIFQMHESKLWDKHRALLELSNVPLPNFLPSGSSSQS